MQKKPGEDTKKKLIISKDANVVNVKWDRAVLQTRWAEKEKKRGHENRNFHAPFDTLRLCLNVQTQHIGTGVVSHRVKFHAALGVKKLIPEAILFI